MGFLKALYRPHIALLWISQVLSAMGDYLYSLAVIWIAVKSVGSDAGLVAAASAISQLVFGLLGGVYADRWSRRKIMVVTDSIRAIIVALLAFLAMAGTVQFWQLVVAAVVIGSLGSLFDPALQASLPSLAGDAKTLQATNGLMDVTTRLARVLGPGMAGLLLTFMPLPQFFTLDAVSFGISALAILSLGRHILKIQPLSRENVGVKGVWQDIQGAVKIVVAHRPLAWSIALGGVLSMVWSASFMIGLPLFVDRTLRGDVGALGLIIGAYGVGNVISNLAIGSIAYRRRIPMIFVGKIIVGLGFLLMASATSLPLAIVGSACAAVGGPMGDITILMMIQTEIPTAFLGKVYSLRMLSENAGSSIGLLLAVPLFAHVSVTIGIMLCALVMIALGFTGLLRLGWKDSDTQRNRAIQYGKPGSSL